MNRGISLSFAVAGEGPLAVLSHGFADSSATWGALATALADGYRVAVLDCRGYPRSDQPAAASDYAMDRLIEDVASVLAAEQRQTATLIGHDVGGAIAWRFALARPQRVDALAILSMPHPAAYARDIGDSPAQRAAYERWHSGQAAQRSPSSAMLNYFRANDFTEPRGPLQAVSLNLPVLVIHGADDQVILPSAQAHIREYLSNDSAMLSVPGAGHWPHHDEPAIVRSAIRGWLDLHRAL